MHLQDELSQTANFLSTSSTQTGEGSIHDYTGITVVHHLRAARTKSWRLVPRFGRKQSKPE